MDLQAYYGRLRKVRAELDEQYPEGSCYITSIQNATSGAVGGAISLATTQNAAKCLTEGTHRIATDEEVTAFKALQTLNRTDAQDHERRRDAGTYLFIPGRGAK